MPHSTIPYAANPVERGNEQPEESAPDAAESIGKRCFSRDNRIRSVCAGSKRRKHLEKFAEATTSEKEVLLLFDKHHRPNANDDHQHEITQKNYVV